MIILNKSLTAFTVLMLAILACTRVTPSVQLPLPDIHASPLPTLLTTLEETPAGQIVTVIVTGEFVNIRSAQGATQGLIAQRGQVLTVRMLAGEGFAVILDPPEYYGMLIWRGCTSEPAGYGCEAEK